MTRVVGIVQARMGSRRLPGKSLVTLGRWPILEWVLRRIRLARSLDEIVVATSRLDQDDVLCEVSRRMHFGCYRGAEQDVLHRHLEAARDRGAEVVVRVCADCPLVDAAEVDRIVEHHLATGADYSFNHIPARGNDYPDGLGAEVVARDCLERLDTLSTRQRHREHVTAYIWENPRRFQIETVAAPAEIAGPDIRLDVDTLADLRRLEKLVTSRDIEPEQWRGSDIVTTYRRVHGGP